MIAQHAALNGSEVYRVAFLEALQPEHDFTVSEWADQHRKLDTRSSSEPGPYRTLRTPYMKEIMDCLSAESPVEEVVFMKGSQIGASEAGTNWLGYIIDAAPGPTLCVQPTLGLLGKFSRQRIDTMVRAAPRLRRKVATKRSRDESNTLEYKEFPGGALLLACANSASGLRSMPIKNLFLDEIDAYPVDLDGEGDPVELAERGTRTFSRRKKMKVSTPTIKGVSRIEQEYEKSSQGLFLVPCHHCKHFQQIYWKRKEDGRRGIRWETDSKGEVVDVWYCCESCDSRIAEGKKTWMLQRGRWVHRFPDRKVRGFHLSALYSPLGWYSWRNAVEKFLEVKRYPEQLKVWVNQTLGESWEEKFQGVEWEKLYRRREKYERGKVPAGGLVLTAGVDVQADRLEVEVVAWGEGLESWSIDYAVLPGDPTRDDVWSALDQVVDRHYPHATANASLQPRMIAVDTGFETQNVYRQLRKRGRSRWMATKGRVEGSSILGSPTTVDIRKDGRRVEYAGMRLWPVGTSTAKRELYGWLQLEPPLREGEGYAVGYCHFPEYDEEYFKQLTAERVKLRPVRGYMTYVWEQVRPRNEALDVRVLARASAFVLGLDRWQESDWKRLAEELDPKHTHSQQEKSPRSKQRHARRKSGGFFDRFRE